MRFAIFGLPRSGSHMLRDLLNQHPELQCAGELFNPSYMAVPYNLDKVFQTYLTGSKAGFILHADNGNAYSKDRKVQRWAPLWADLPARLDRVVVLRRRNRLARYVSGVVAQKRKGWQFYEVPPPVPPFELDRARAEQVLAAEALLLSSRMFWFREHPQCRVFYEELCEDLDATLARVHAFLNVPNIPAKPSTAKVGIPLCEQITNYDEVRHLEDPHQEAVPEA
jgi:hypothetical protein